jgi:type II secretory ATPase GspE/PulE/Tfp pilus assembly ATPase PilB-like protein
MPNKEKYFLSPPEIKNLAKIVDLDRMLSLLQAEKIVGPTDTWDKIPFYKAKRINEFEDGYSNRIGMHEVMKVTATIRDMIIKGSSQDEIEAQAKKEGMMTMLEDGVYQAVLGVTTLEEVFRVVSE